MTILNNGTRVISAFFMETGTTPDMPARNYTASVHTGSMNQLLDATNNGANINVLSLASVASDIITPDMNRQRDVSIPNSFNNKRLRFLFILGNPSHPTADGHRTIISGYTDSPAFALNSVDFAPEMQLFFNNAITVSQSTVPNMQGQMIRHINVNECNQILHPRALGSPVSAMLPAWNTNGDGFSNLPSYLRPMDILRCSQSKSREFEGVIDARPMPTMQLSSRNNTIPAHYMDRTLSAMAQGAHQMEHGGATNYVGNSIMGFAAASAAENSISRNFFLDNLATNYNYQSNGFVTWADLKRANPELSTPDVVKLFRSRDIRAQNKDVYISNRGDFDTMSNNSSIHSQLISQVLQSVAALVLQNLIVECNMVITNATPTGAVSVVINSANPLIELPQGYLPSKIPGLCRELEQIVFSNMGTNNYGVFDLTLSMNTFGETFARLMYNGIEFKTSVPSYCDAIHSHMVSQDNVPLTNIADSLSYVGFNVLGMNDTQHYEHSGITPSWSSAQSGYVNNPPPEQNNGGVIQPVQNFTTQLPPVDNSNGNGYF